MEYACPIVSHCSAKAGRCAPLCGKCLATMTQPNLDALARGEGMPH
jgi:hypothetical protein